MKMTKTVPAIEGLQSSRGRQCIQRKRYWHQINLGSKCPSAIYWLNDFGSITP